MDTIFQHERYLLKRQVFALTGKFRYYDPMGNLVMFSEQKMFKLREDIRVFFVLPHPSEQCAHPTQSQVRIERCTCYAKAICPPFQPVCQFGGSSHCCAANDIAVTVQVLRG